MNCQVYRISQYLEEKKIYIYPLFYGNK